jgi:4-hydroxy-tetrahydrodipicolinate synthase
MFKGSITALITPFRNGSVDEDALRQIVDWQITEGTHGLVPTGTTGESPTLNFDEHKRVVEITIEASRGRVPVIAGTGSNSTAEAIELSEDAEKAGATGLLIVTPYYNKPTQEGLFQHFKAINDAVGIPILIYNIPGRSIVDMSVATMARLFELKNIIGVKDATANLARVSQQRAAMGPEFGRGCDGAWLHGAWRQRLHLGCFERGAEALRRVPERLSQGRLQGGARATGPAHAAA